MSKIGNRFETPGRLARFLAGFDWLQLGALAVLLGVGVMFIHSTGVQIGTVAALNSYLRQLQWITLGFCVFLVFSLIDYRRLLLPSIVFYAGCLVLLVAVFFIGVKVYGAQRWISLPGLGMRLQPSELTKLAVTLVLAALFSSRLFAIDDTGERGGRRRPGQLLGLGAALLIIAVPFLLIVKQPDLGSALILPPIGGAVILVAGLRWKSLAWILAILLLVLSLAIINETAGIHPLLKEYQRERILVFLDPERDLANRGYNQFQARLAVGSGGMWGKGIGQGTQNLLGFLPQSVSNNDFIFSVIAEETGFAGGLALLAVYLVLLYSIMRTAMLTGDPFGRYIGIGVATMLFTHIFVNIGMSVGLAPVTGLPLPFISYGGSFILTGMAAMGLMQSIYRYREPVEE